MASPSEDSNLSPDALRKLLTDLLNSWLVELPETAQLRRDRQYGDELALMVVGFAAHVHRLGRAIAVLGDVKLWVEAMPLVRTAWELGVTAQWAVQYGDDALSAVLSEDNRQRKATAGELQKMMAALSGTDADKLVALLNAGVDSVDTTADPSARHFQQRCRDLVGGEVMYLAYRAMSGYVHPGPTIAGMYRSDSEHRSMQLVPREVGPPDTTWIINTCVALIWAGRAVDMMDRQHPRRGLLRSAARTLGIPTEIRLSEQAEVRRSKDQARRKRERRSAH